MNFSPKTCCRLCAKGHKKDDINVLKDLELEKSIETIYGIEMQSSELSTFICSDCRISTIAFSANYDRVQYVQGQLVKYASMSSARNETVNPPAVNLPGKQPVPKLLSMPVKHRVGSVTLSQKPYDQTEPMKFKLGDEVKFVSFGKLIRGVIDGLFSKQKKYQIKTAEGEIYKIFHLSVILDDQNTMK